MKKSYKINVTSGPLLGKILLFSIPLVLSNMLQLLFNAADIIVADRFAGSGALAAVGFISSLISLLINISVGLLVGVNALVTRYYRAQNSRNVSETAHTAIATNTVSGLILVVLGILLTNPLPRLMGTPEDVLGQSVLYMRIRSLGMPILTVYNFGMTILRAIENIRRPLYLLFTFDVVNVHLNLFFVVVLGVGVDGVIWTTVMSEHISAFLALKNLVGTPGVPKLGLKQLRIHTRKLKRTVKIELPVGIQRIISSTSNILVQSSVNSFSSIVMAGNTASSNIEDFVYTAINVVYQTNLSFTSQDLGGRKYNRTDKIMYIYLGMVTAVGVILESAAVATGDGLLHIYSSGPEALRCGMLRLEVICGIYSLYGTMDCMMGSLGGLGYSITPMSVSLTGTYGLGVSWVFTVFVTYRSLDILHLSYPVSWAVITLAHVMILHKIRRKPPKRDATSMQPASL